MLHKFFGAYRVKEGVRGVPSEMIQTVIDIYEPFKPKFFSAKQVRDKLKGWGKR